VLGSKNPCIEVILGIIIGYIERMTRKQKNLAKPFELAKQGQKKPSGIRLQDLMPKKRVTGGKGLLFGASDSSQPLTHQPEETYEKK
jgi:hypothetical protein